MAKKDNSFTERLVLLDAHAILHRAYHALPDFASKSGEPTGALYGLSLMLLKIINELRPDYIVACYDLPEPTHRHTAYEDYKATRQKMDDALAVQINESRKVFEAFDIPIYEKGGFEADDILGTIAGAVKKKKGLQVVIASGDMDTLQLVEDGRVVVYTLRKGIQDTVLYDELAVTERFGFAPELLPDYKGLRGDPSDNIIGVPGIGEKTATELICAFGTIENIYKALKKDPQALIQKGIKQRIIDILSAHEEEALFSKALATIHRDVPIHFELAHVSWAKSISRSKVHALFSDLGFRSLIERTKNLFNSETPTEEPEEAAEEDAPPAEAVTETAVALWLIDSERTNPTLEDIYAYAGTRTFKEARAKIMLDLEAQGLSRVFNEIERPLIPVVARMREQGIGIDTEVLARLSKTYRKDLEKLEDKIYTEAGVTFNINSPKQLGEVLFDKLGLGTGRIKRTATGAKSTRESELEKMRDAHPIIGLILDYRELQKLLSTYIDVIPRMIGEDGRLHAQFSQTGTTTGRMSSQNPNLQNIPIRTELGKAIRHAFVAAPGHVLVSCDYSQIELRVAAFLSGDEKLIEIFKSGRDIHREVAAQVFRVDAEDVDSEMRRRAKVINFGILYGMGVNALRANLGTSRNEAQEFLDAYFANFPGLTRYLEETKAQALREGYTATLFGRRRYFSGIRSPLPYIRAAAERMAVNAPIQGTQADIIKLAMVRIDEYFRSNGLIDRTRLLLQVHDELVFEIAKEVEVECVEKIIEIMESVVSEEDRRGVPILVDAAAGPNWGELTEF